MTDAKRALVTGATGAVGSELLRLLGGAGWRVLGVHRGNAERATAARDRWNASPDLLELRACDLSDTSAVESLHASLPADYCPDALIHLAAPGITATPVHRTNWAGFQAHLDGGFKPVVQLTQPLLGRMLQRGAGRVIAALSMVVLNDPPRGFSSYTAAKYALAGYMKCIATEYAGRGISANTVSPGLMDSGQLRELPALLRDQMRAAMPGGTWVSPTAVARAIYWLAAEAGPEITGCNVPLTTGTSG